MKQNRWVWILSISFLLLQSCTKSITGEGPVRSETRQIDAFSSIRLNGSGNVEIVRAPNQQLTISGYSNLLDVYESVVNKGELTIGFKSRLNIRNDNIVVKIELPDVRGVNINGSGDVLINGFQNGIELGATINGSGRIKIQQSAFDKMMYHINGSGDIFAAGIPAKNTEATISGSGFIELNCLQNLKIRISGSGTVDYYGNPPATDISISGSGVVRKK